MAPPCINKEDKLNGNNYAHLSCNSRPSAFTRAYGSFDKASRRNQCILSTLRSELQSTMPLFRKSFKIGRIEIKRPTQSCFGPSAKKFVQLFQTLASAAKVWSTFCMKFQNAGNYTYGAVVQFGFASGNTMQPFHMKPKVIHEQILSKDAALTFPQLTTLILTRLHLIMIWVPTLWGIGSQLIN